MAEYGRCPPPPHKHDYFWDRSLDEGERGFLLMRDLSGEGRVLLGSFGLVSPDNAGFFSCRIWRGSVIAELAGIVLYDYFGLCVQ